MATVAECLGYWWRVLCRAGREASGAFKDWILQEAVIVAAVLFVGIILSSITTLPWPDIVTVFMVPFVALALIVLVLFVGGVAYAPALIDHEQRSAIAVLNAAVQPRGEVKIRHQPNPHQVYVLVTNEGPTNDFVAQVTAIQGMEATTPYAVRWREWESEARPIASGASALLDLGSTDWYTEQSGGPNFFYRFLLRSTGGDFYSSSVEARRRAPGQESNQGLDWPLVVSESELSRQVSVLLEVNAIDPSYRAKAWFRLGFTADCNLLVETELTES